MNKRICNISLFSAILACVVAVPADAAIRNKSANRSYAGAYQQVNAMRYEQEYANNQLATTASATADLPVAVTDEKLAEAIANNATDAPSVSSLQSCARIHPSGVFRWEVPTSGNIQIQSPQCVAVVELRDANSNAVLATATVGAGDSMKCNIDYFPQKWYNMSALSKVMLPADKEPTIEDVEAIMDEEQRQNAGLKIAAATLVAGVAGNLLAPKEAGAKESDIPLGTGASQLKGTAIAAATGASVMAASVYSGKVAGDTIKSTAVNAASGMIVGNMLAGINGGGGVLAITKCGVPINSDSDDENVSTTEYDCIVGTFKEQGEPLGFHDGEKEQTGHEVYYLINLNKEIKMCYKDEVLSDKPNQQENRETIYKQNECVPYTQALMDINIYTDEAAGKSISFTTIERKNKKDNNTKRQEMPRWRNGYTDGSKWIAEKVKIDATDDSSTDTFYKIKSANHTKGSGTHAYAVYTNGSLDKFGGYEDLEELENENIKPIGFYSRNRTGSVGREITICKTKDDPKGCKEGKFEPDKRDASDGGLVDLTNENRIKGTVAGGAVGGVLGGVAGYSGAKDEVTDRYYTSLREYEDSLTNFVCVTGGWYLSAYNSYVEIPELKENKQ